MWRWTMRIFVVLGAFLIVAALSGATYQWLADLKGAGGDSASRTFSSTSEAPGCICGAAGTARLPSSSTRARRLECFRGVRPTGNCSIHACLL